MNSTRLLQVFLFMGALLISAVPHAADITISVNDGDASGDGLAVVDLPTLLPLADASTWIYNLQSFPGFSASKEVTATMGPREKIGGGCLRLQPMVFGEEMALYLGNYGDSLSLHGIYLKYWKGMEDVLLKFETRNRVEWLDFRNRFVNVDATPIDANSCQDTGRGRVERGGAVLMENLTTVNGEPAINFGQPGKKKGEINCKVKNTDLRDNFNGGQQGTGLAVVGGVNKTLTWVVDSFAMSESGGVINIDMAFRPVINSSQNNYTMYFDITFTPGQGITELYLTDDGSNTLNDENDLHYVLAAQNLASPTNEITPGGKCPEDSGRISYMLALMLLVIATRRRILPI